MFTREKVGNLAVSAPVVEIAASLPIEKRILDFCRQLRRPEVENLFHSHDLVVLGGGYKVGVEPTFVATRLRPDSKSRRVVSRVAVPVWESDSPPNAQW